MQFELVKKPKEEKSDISPPKPRMYDVDGFSLRGSCIVWDSYKKENTLLIKNKKNMWCLSGGGIEPFDKSFINGALRELREESGIIGKATNFVGNFKDYKGKNKHSTFVWDVIVTSILDEYKENYRERRWFPYTEAYEKLNDKPEQQNILFQSKNINRIIEKPYYSNPFECEYNLWKNKNAVLGKI